MTPRETLILEMRRDRRFAPDLVKSIAKVFEALDFQGDDVPDAKALFSAIEWVIARPDTIEKRLEAISRLFALGKVDNLDIQQFYALQ